MVVVQAVRRSTWREDAHIDRTCNRPVMDPIPRSIVQAFVAHEDDTTVSVIAVDYTTVAAAADDDTVVLPFVFLFIPLNFLFFFVGHAPIIARVTAMAWPRWDLTS